VLISGYYGFRNLGDESLLQAIVQNIRKASPSTEIVAFSMHPDETAEKYNVKSVNRHNPFSICREFAKGGVLLSGGGSLLQDVTSTQSIMYYLTIMRFAKLFGLKSMVYANGIGPIKIEKNKRRTKKTLARVDKITLRDENSREELISMGIDESKLIVTADPAFSLEIAADERANYIIKSTGLKSTDKVFVVSVREYYGNCTDFCDKMAEIVDNIEEKYGFIPLLFPMQPRDRAISQKICRLAVGNARVIEGDYNANDVLSLLKRSELVIGMRLHMLIYAARACVPMLALSYDPKVDAIMQLIGQDERKYNVAELNADEVMEGAISVVAQYKEISKELKKQVKIMQDKTKIDVGICLELADKAKKQKN
jgi:polysaccharide pyruvyl transferase CsaB